MNSLFQGNLAALAERYPALASRLAAHVPSPDYQLTPTASGQFDLTVGAGGSATPFYGVPSPLEDAQAYWRSNRIRNPGLMVFLGLDLGYRLFAYMASPSPNTHAYLLVEKDFDVFYKLLHMADIRPLVRDPDVHFAVGVPEDRLFIELRDVLQHNLLYTKVKATHIEGNSASYRRNEEYYRKVLVAVRDAIQDLLALAGNAPHDSFIGVRHMLLNLETIAREPGVKDLFGRFAGRPAVIVATGPSLDRNYHLLAEIQNRAVILSVDASFQFLLRNGIRPHLVACLERVPQTVPFFDGLDREACKECVQVAVPVVVPDVYSVYRGPKALAYRRFAHFEWLENDKGTLSTGQSSANMAFKLAEALGCSSIILVGQDLAYADDGSTHSSAAYWGKISEAIRPERTQVLRVRGNLRDWVVTNRTWEGFRRHYTRDVAAYAGTVVNATEGGAYIEGTQVLSLQEAIDGFVGDEFPVAEEILDNLRTPDPAETEKYLGWLRMVRIPETIACLESKIEEAERLAGDARSTVENDAGSDDFTNRVAVALRFYNDMFSPGLFHTAAAHIVQPAFVQTMVDHHDAPNRFSHVYEVNRSRLELHGRFLSGVAKMLRKTRDLYADPANTLP
jgi:hypothetical protein